MEVNLVSQSEATLSPLITALGAPRAMFLDIYAKTNNVSLAASQANIELSEAEKFVADRPRWFVQGLRTLTREKTLQVAEDGLLEIVNLPIYTTNDDGEEVIDKEILRAKLDAIKYATSTLGNDTYNTKTKNETQQTNVNIFQILKDIERKNVIEGTILDEIKENI